MLGLLLLTAGARAQQVGTIVGVREQGSVVFTNVRPSPQEPAAAAPASATRSADAEPPVIRRLLRRTARRYGLNPGLLREVARQESDFHPRSVSDKGALGLMQLMPETARALGVRHPFNAAENADGGARYLKSLLQLYHGNLRLTLAAYNAGPGAVARYGDQIPPYQETRQYVRNITRRLRGQSPASGSAAVGTPPPVEEAESTPLVEKGLDREGNPVFTNLP